MKFKICRMARGIKLFKGQEEAIPSLEGVTSRKNVRFRGAIMKTVTLKYGMNHDIS